MLIQKGDLIDEKTTSHDIGSLIQIRLLTSRQ